MPDTFMEEIGIYLAAQGVGTYGLDTDIDWGIYVINQPGAIEKVVLITPTPSTSDPDIPTTTRTFQVLTLARSTKEALDKAGEIHDLLARQIDVDLSSIKVFSFTAVSMPFYLGRDADKRARIAANYSAFAQGNHV